MWDFFSKYGNWLLAAVAVAFWGGAFGWYFYGVGAQAWRDRFDGWTKR